MILIRPMCGIRVQRTETAKRRELKVFLSWSVDIEKRATSARRYDSCGSCLAAFLAYAIKKTR